MAVKFPFCPNCGSETLVRILGRDRDYCSVCDRVYYVNPVAAAAGVLVEDGPAPAGWRILLARRASSVFPGHWYIPAGFCEVDETIRECCVREMKEETGLDVEIEGLLDAISGFEVPGRPVVGVYFRVHRTGGDLAPNDDVDRLQFFGFDEVPELVFAGDREIVQALRRQLLAS
jgi:8-oxo-dGTP diphosphatase